VFRTPGYPGRRGRPRLVLAAGFRLGQMVKQYAKRRVVSVQQRVVPGTAEAITAVLTAPAPGRVRGGAGALVSVGHNRAATRTQLGKYSAGAY
jgi:hypothetical protein